MFPAPKDALPGGEVHVWIANVNVPAPLAARLEDTLSHDERSQAGRFVFEHHRRRYSAAHGILRDILARYVAKEPREIVFSLNAFGKPFLPEGDENRRLFFNMSHAGDLVVVALARDRLIGVDVEFIRPVPEIDAIAEYNFAPQERALIVNSSASDREPLFFTCWTRKEAYIKAVGKGLSLPLDSFDVSVPPGASGRSIEPTKDSPGVAGWWLSDLIVPPGYKGAVVVEDGFDRLSSRNWIA